MELYLNKPLSVFTPAREPIYRSFPPPTSPPLAALPDHAPSRPPARAPSTRALASTDISWGKHITSGYSGRLTVLRQQQHQPTIHRRPLPHALSLNFVFLSFYLFSTSFASSYFSQIYFSPVSALLNEKKQTTHSVQINSVYNLLI